MKHHAIFQTPMAASDAKRNGTLRTRSLSPKVYCKSNRARVRVAAGLLIGVLMGGEVTADGRGASGEPLWQDNVSDGSARAITTWGKSMFAGAFVVDEAAVRAYEGRTGELIWENRFAGIERDVRATVKTLAARNGRVYAAGHIQNFGSSVSFVLRTYAADSGELLWDGDVSSLSGSANALAAGGKRVFAVGSVGFAAAPYLLALDFTVRAYAAGTGELLWEDRVDGTAKDNELDDAKAVVVQGSRVFAAGVVDNSSGSPFDPTPFPFVRNADFFIRAYRADTGEPLWQDLVDGAAGVNDQANAIAARGHRVFAAGFVSNDESSTDFTVRAYRARTGELLWQDLVPDGAANAVAAQGNRVFGAGSIGGGFVVQAYAARTGELLWRDTVSDGSAAAITMNGQQVLVAGSIAGAFTVRAYRARTGELLWQDLIPEGSANAIAAQGRRVFGAGSIAGGFAVKAYGAKRRRPTTMTMVTSSNE